MMDRETKQQISYRENKTEQGGVLLLVMVIMIVFIAMTTYTLRFVVRQSHETVNQEQEEQAFGAADSGVSYTLWLLNPSGGNYDTGDIAALSAITDHPVTDNLGRQIGTFSLVDIVAGTRFLQLRSVGKDAVLSNKCQTIFVKLRQLELGEPYVVTQWDHQVGVSCP
jgi:hypothetical protein